jgi:hypothetical protein
VASQLLLYDSQLCCVALGHQQLIVQPIKHTRRAAQQLPLQVLLVLVQRLQQQQQQQQA